MVKLAAITWIPQPPTWRIDWDTINRACPWLATLAATPQDPSYHAEGDVLTHTRMVTEALVALAAWRALPANDRAALLLAALLHDISKPATTTTDERGRIVAPGHARLGATTARGLLWSSEGIGAALGFSEREQIAMLVRLHGLPLWFIERTNIEQAILPASLRTRLSHVALLAEADARGRICADQQELLARIALFRDWCGEHHCLDQPYPFPSAHSRVRYCRALQHDPTYHAYDDTWGEITMLAGLPGVGKDTWLQAHAQDRPSISLDAIRAELHIAPEDNQGAVIETAKARARVWLRQQQPFNWNATNLTRQIRDPLISLFLNYGARVRIIYLDAPLAPILERNRGRRAAVPERIIRRLATRTEPPDLTEAHGVTVVEA